MSGFNAQAVPPLLSNDGAVLSPQDRAVIPARWPGHGIDIRMLVETGPGIARVTAFATDVCTAIGIDVEVLHGPDGRPVERCWPSMDNAVEIPGIVAPDGVHERLWTVADITALAEGLDANARALAAWLGETADYLTSTGLERVIEASTPAEPPRPTDERTYSFSQAAQILGRDLGKRIKVHGLFETLGDPQGGTYWIHRDHLGTWIPDSRIRKAGLLIVQQRHYAGNRPPHPQIRITELGMARLREQLADASSTPTLIDLP